MARSPEMDRKRAAAQLDYIERNATIREVADRYDVALDTAHRWRKAVAGVIAAALAERNAKVTSELQISAERVLEEYARIAFYNPGRVFKKDENGLPKIDYSDADDSDFAVIQEVSNEQVGQLSLDLDGDGKTRTTKAKVKLYSKMDALNQIGKHLGMFTDKVDVTSNGKELTTIRVVYADADPDTADPAPGAETDS